MRADVKLKEVARLCDHTHFDIPKQSLGARRGPYPFYGDLFERFEVDDYGIDAPGVVFMAAAGRVLNNEGGFRLALEHGRCGANPFAHVVVPFDSSAAEYLAACLAFHPHAVDYIGGPNQLQTLDELAVLRIGLPWPCAQTRSAFVSALAQAQAQVTRAHDAREAARRAGASQKELTAMDVAFDKARGSRYALANDFLESGVLPGFDCSPCLPDFGHVPVSYSDARADRARLELAQKAADQASRDGGIVVPTGCEDRLGVLTGLVKTDTAGLSSEDVAWELGPLAVVRACAAPEAWGRVHDMCSVDDVPARSSLVAALDAAMDALAADNECLTFLPNLSYGSSTLDDVRLARWCRILDGLDPASISVQAVRAVFDLAHGAPLVPAEVADIFANACDACLSANGGRRAYIANSSSDALADIPSRVGGVEETILQCDGPEALYQACMVRAVAMRGASTSGSLLAEAPSSSALLRDCFPSSRADVVLAEVPDPWKAWSDRPPHRDDPRWLLGVPTRMRPTFAWAEHCLSHLSPTGAAFMLVATSELQSRRPVDEDILANLIQRGHVSAVVALPARIWGDGRPPMSILVLRTPQEARPCLMVDATELDVSGDLSHFLLAPQRRVSADGAKALGELLGSWLALGARRDAAPIPHRVVFPAEVINSGFLLAPWHYLDSAR